MLIPHADFNKFVCSNKILGALRFKEPKYTWQIRKVNLGGGWCIEIQTMRPHLEKVQNMSR